MEDRYPFAEALIFDTHAHYDDAKFDESRDRLLSRELPENGVCGIITCGCDGDSSRTALQLAEQHDYVFAAVGIHPENLSSGTAVDEIERLAAHPKCVAIGEIGLDYYWNDSAKEQQKAIFREQLLLANHLQKPVIVHDRDAHADTLSLLQETNPCGVVHCFSGSPEMAREILKLGMYIGVGGSLTFKNARRLPEVTAEIPIDRLLLETDCPYLAPEPFRGKCNRSDYILYVARRVAEIRSCPIEEILHITAQNAQKLFGI